MSTACIYRLLPAAFVQQSYNMAMQLVYDIFVIDCEEQGLGALSSYTK